jgi:hypothetical protein
MGKVGGVGFRAHCAGVIGGNGIGPTPLLGVVYGILGGVKKQSDLFRGIRTADPAHQGIGGFSALGMGVKTPAPLPCSWGLHSVFGGFENTNVHIASSVWLSGVHHFL